MAGSTVHVVKRNSKKAGELFNHDKLYASIYASCLSERCPEGQAKVTATAVCEAVASWCATKPEVTTADIRIQASKALEVLHPNAAYFYKHHRVIV